LFGTWLAFLHAAGENGAGTEKPITVASSEGDSPIFVGRKSVQSPSCSALGLHSFTQPAKMAQAPRNQ
jgi:hypothetical protein